MTCGNFKEKAGSYRVASGLGPRTPRNVGKGRGTAGVELWAFGLPAVPDDRRTRLSRLGLTNFEKLGLVQQMPPGTALVSGWRFLRMLSPDSSDGVLKSAPTVACLWDARCAEMRYDGCKRPCENGTVGSYPVDQRVLELLSRHERCGQPAGQVCVACPLGDLQIAPVDSLIRFVEVASGFIAAVGRPNVESLDEMMHQLVSQIPKF
jgi:hypothetical protein